MRRFAGAFVAVFVVALLAGWFLRQFTMRAPETGASFVLTRETGYHFTNPVLTCSEDSTGTLDMSVEKAVQGAVNAEIGKGDVNIASVYYRRFLDNRWAVVNGEEQYYPASLNKVPLMMAYYDWIEATDFPVLTKQIELPAGPDRNVQQEVKPEHPLAVGQTYAVSDLLSAMVQDSDNNATVALLQNIDTGILRKVFTDLHVPFLAPGEPPGNYMDVSDYAFFFRVLYNATYLSHDDSERALAAMSGSTFKDGLVAGVPAGTVVAHKFGLVSVAPGNAAVTAREMHDCGIIYPPGKGPYLLCVMTKSTGTLQGAEQTLAAISRAAYEYAAR